jgi:hypothetical protein
MFSVEKVAKLKARGFTDAQIADLALTGFFPPEGMTWAQIQGQESFEEPAKREASGASEHSDWDLRDKLIAWMTASGATVLEISQELNLPDYQITLLQSAVPVVRKIRQIKEEYWGANMTKQFDQAAPAALKLATQMVTGELPGLKASERWSAAQWILEKSTGKPKQEVELSGDHTLRHFFAELELLKEARAAGTLTSVIDVTPEPLDEIDQWVADHVPLLEVEKK